MMIILMLQNDLYSFGTYDHGDSSYLAEKCDLLCNLIFFIFDVSRESNVDSHWKFSKREVILKYQQ